MRVNSVSPYGFKLDLVPPIPVSVKEELCKKLNLHSHIFELGHKSQPHQRAMLAFIRVFLLEKGEHCPPFFLSRVIWFLKLEQLEKWITSEKSSDLFDKECKDLIPLDDKVVQFLSMRCSSYCENMWPSERFLNPNMRS